MGGTSPELVVPGAAPAGTELEREVLAGLSRRPRQIPGRYLFDVVGLELFQRFTAGDDYYPARCEREILTQHGAALTALLRGRPLDVIDLGAASGSNAEPLLEVLTGAGLELRYLVAGSCPEAVRGIQQTIRRRFPELKVRGLIDHQLAAIARLRVCASDRSQLVIMLGCSLASHSPAEALALLRRCRRVLRAGDHLLIGFDLRKSTELLLSGPPGNQELAAAFNLNLLSRLNRELDSNFEASRFRHFGTYNASLAATESFLLSTVAQEVYLGRSGDHLTFAPWESIQTARSYKYLDDEIEVLAMASGFELAALHFDRQRYFAEALLGVPASS